MTRTRRDTRTRLVLLRNVMLLVTLALGLGATFAYTQMNGAADTASTRAVPVLRELSASRTALLRADLEAVKSFTSGAVALVGAGDQHRDYLASATSGLTRVAEKNQAGPEGIGQIQLVQSLLAAYSSSVEQAASQFRQPGGRALGTADLWQASRLVYDDSGVLKQLDLAELQQRGALTEAIQAGAPSVLTVLLWAVPGAVLLALLVGGQVWLARHFRRRLNPWLLGATALVFVVLGTTFGVFDSQRQLAAAETELLKLDAEWGVHDKALLAHARYRMWDLLKPECAPMVDCGPTVREFAEKLPVYMRLAQDEVLLRRADEIAAKVSEVDGRWMWVVVIPVTSVLVMALVVFGLQARIHEYRVVSR